MLKYIHKIKKGVTKMRKYFADGKQITEKEAEEIKLQNNQFLKSSNISDWKKCKFLVVID